MECDLYPRLEIDLGKIRHNVQVVVNSCHQHGISVVGVTKGFSGIPEIAQIMIDGGVDILGDSRILNLQSYSSITVPKMLLRIPMVSEANAVVKYADYSLNSELYVIKELNQAARAINKIHKIILMIDVGDIREGIYDHEEMVEIVQELQKLSNIQLIGLGTNLKCFGGILPTHENLQKIVSLKHEIQNQFGCQIEVLSGGNSASYYLIETNQLPEEINQLRLGEALILGNERAFFTRIQNTYNDAFRLSVEIIEKKTKPSTPIGIISQTTINHTPQFEDKGNQIRAICALGKQDVDFSTLIPEDPRIQIIGGSSDHLILDLSKCSEDYCVGDHIDFLLTYYGIVHLTTSKYVHKIFFP